MTISVFVSNGPSATTGGGTTTVVAAPYRPHKLLVYYGTPEAPNLVFDNEYAAQTFARYDLIVLGNGVANPSHGSYANSVAVMARTKVLHPDVKFFGYIEMGVNPGSNLSLGQMQTQVGQWVTAGAGGIFFDTVGYDYQVSRARMNAMVDYCHDLDLAVICNSWVPADVMGATVNATYNPGGTPTAMGSDDYYLLESWVTNEAAYTTTGGYSPMGDLKTKADAARALRATTGCKLLALSTMDYATAGEPEMALRWGMHETASLIWSMDGYGMSPTNYSATSPNANKVRRHRYNPDVNRYFNSTAGYQINGGWTEAYRADFDVTLHLDTATSTYSFTPAAGPPAS